MKKHNFVRNLCFFFYSYDDYWDKFTIVNIVKTVRYFLKL